MKRNKSGISLIVLVITIIVMVILAAAIIISLDNAGIIDKANTAVEQTNEKQVQQIAALAWAEAYADGKTSQAELEEYVLAALEKNKVDTDKYDITVSTTGVEVEQKGTTTALNEYGFYFDKVYVGTVEANPMGITKIGLVFHEDGSSEGYGGDETTGDTLFCAFAYEAKSMQYSDKAIVLADGEGSNITVSPDGRTMTGTYQGFAISATLSTKEIHGGYRNKTYSAQVEGMGKFEATIDNSNVATLYLNGTKASELNVNIIGKDHIIIYGGNQIGALSTDGKQLQLYVEGVGMVWFTLDEGSTSTNPDNVAEHPYTNAEWEVAWVYDNGTWTEVAKGGNATGSMVAKLYPTGSKVTPTATETNTNSIISAFSLTEGDAYALVIEGQGDMPALVVTGDNANVYAWQCASMEGVFADKYTDGMAPYLYYITEGYVCSGITSIGDYCFSRCASLQKLYIADSVTRFEKSALMGLEKLTAINMPTNLTFIGETALYYNTLLTSVTIPSKVTSIGVNAFEGCSGLKNVVIQNTDATTFTIGTGAFMKLAQNSTITVYNTVVRDALTDKYDSTLTTVVY